MTSAARSILLAIFCSTAMAWTAVSLPAAEATSKPDPLDWPSWRGPEQNGISREKNLVSSWSPDGENVLWSRDDIGSISTPIVLNGKLYTLCRQKPGTKLEAEKVIAVDAATGATVWENIFNVYLSDVPDTRVAWSSCAGDPATGRIYAQGVCGLFQCIDGETGKTIWSRSMSEEFGALNTYGGRTNVPVLFEDLVIISAVMTGWGELAVPAHRVLALDKNTGEVVWLASTRPRPEDTTYSTPSVAVLNGQAALVLGSGDGALYALQPRTGNVIWKYLVSRRGMDASPLVVGDRVYMCQSEENPDDNSMGAVFAVDGRGTGDISSTGAIWRVKEKTAGKSSPLLVNDRLYVTDDSAGIWMFDPETGKENGKRQKLGSIMRSSLLYADGKIYATEKNGRCYIFEPTKQGLKQLHRVKLSEGEECQGSPIASHGRVYINSTGHVYCLGVKDQKPEADPRPALPAEQPVTEKKPAQAQVLPAEVLLTSGAKQTFRVRLFNSRGQIVSDKNVKAKFTLEGPGSIDEQGNFTAATGANPTATILTATVDDLKTTARIRVVPPLPWKFDFADGQVPVTWIGARARHIVRDLEGDKVLVKVTTIPKGTRSQSWMGPTNLANYVVQADVRGAVKEGKLPDVGVIAQRYALDLLGASQELQIRTWTAQLEARMGARIHFDWKPDVWYTLKIQSTLEGDVAVVRGKIWERGKPEPTEWTIEARDDFPNRNGSPGLFGNANDAEIYIDNVTVTPIGAPQPAAAGS